MKRELVTGPGALFAAAVIAVLAAAGCRGKAADPPPPPPPAVVVTEALQKDVPIIKEWIGTTEGNVNAEIRPKIDGYLLRRLYAEGAFVREGDPLFAIDPRQFQAQLEQTQGDLEQAQAQLAKARQDVARFRPLVEQKAISQQELDNALSAERAAKATVDSKQAAVHQARLNVSWTRVTSPIGGVAGAAQAQVGNLVNPTTVLTTVSQCDPIRVLYPLSEQEYLRFRQRLEGDSKAAREPGLELVLADGTVFPHQGRVLFEGRQVDVKTGTIQAVAVFPNPGNLLRPGQYAKIRAVTEVRKGAVLVPQRAVNELQGGYQVAVVANGDKAEIRTVQMGARVGTLWVVDSGLAAGERVVVEGFARVKSGASVQPKEESAAEAAGDHSASAPGGK